MADAMKLAEVIETLEGLLRGPRNDDFDRGAWAARLDALDMLRPLAASPPAREEAPAEGAGLEWMLRNRVLPALETGETRHAVEQAIAALRNRTSEPEAGAVGCAELEVGRAVYERIEKLIDATSGPDADELSYLAYLVASVEEVGGYDGPPPPSREEALQAVVDEIKALECGSPAPATADKLREARSLIEDAIKGIQKAPLSVVADTIWTADPCPMTVVDALQLALAALNEKPQ